MEMDWSLKKIGQFFSSFDASCSKKILKKFIAVSPLWKNSFDIFVVALQKHFIYDLSLKVNILAPCRIDLKQQNPRDTAPLNNE